MSVVETVTNSQGIEIEKHSHERRAVGDDPTPVTPLKRRIKVGATIEAETDAYKSREQLEAENALLRERLEMRGGQIDYLSNELSRAQEFATYCADLSNGQADIIETVVACLHAEIVTGRQKTGSRARTRQILAEEMLDAIQETAGYNADYPPVLNEPDISGE